MAVPLLAGPRIAEPPGLDEPPVEDWTPEALREAYAYPPREPWVDEPWDEERSLRSLRNWQRIVRSCQRVRRLQRIWGNLGQFLQLFPAGLRARLRETLTKHD